MILIIDTTDREKMGLKLSDQNNLECFEFETKDQSADILKAIDQVLKKEKLKTQDIKTIVVNQWPGSFTGVRVGIAVANSLAWSLNIPVVGYQNEGLEGAIAEIRDKNFSKIVLPCYPPSS